MSYVIKIIIQDILNFLILKNQTNYYIVIKKTYVNLLKKRMVFILIRQILLLSV